MYENPFARSCIRIPDEQLNITHYACTMIMRSMRTHAKINLREKKIRMIVNTGEVAPASAMNIPLRRTIHGYEREKRSRIELPKTKENN